MGGGGTGVCFGEVAGDCSTKPNDRKKHNITVSQTKMFCRLHLLAILNSCASVRGINFTCLSREHGTRLGYRQTILDHPFFSTVLCTTCESNGVAQHMEPTLWHLRSPRTRSSENNQSLSPVCFFVSRALFLKLGWNDSDEK